MIGGSRLPWHGKRRGRRPARGSRNGTMARQHGRFEGTREWWRRRQRLSRRRYLYRAHTKARPTLPERHPRLAYAFAVLPMLGITLLLAGAPALYRVWGIFTPPTPVAVSNNDDPPNTTDDPPVTVPLPDWGKQERVNILLVGVDRRPDEDFTRTDTIIVVSIDPAGKTVGLMSLPRDLKVTIPGYGDDKINAAYVFGERDKRVGGGIGLLERTIQNNFQIPIHYYGIVDFKGFEKIVDTFGGVNVDPPYSIIDDEYPTEDYGYVGIYFPAGWQHLDGRAALRYARTRHADSDFGRSKRQQEVLLALRQQALTGNLIGKFWSLLGILGDSVHTDLSPDNVAALANLGKDISRDNIKSWTLQDLVGSYQEPDGPEYLIADWPAVRKRMRQMSPNTTVITPLPSPDPTARIAVRNGTERNQFASRSVDRLKAAGFARAVVDSSPVTEATVPLAQSIIYVYTGKSDAAIFAAKTLGLTEDAVRQGTGTPSAGVDILIVLGNDASDPTSR